MPFLPTGITTSLFTPLYVGAALFNFSLFTHISVTYYNTLFFHRQQLTLPVATVLYFTCFV